MAWAVRALADDFQHRAIGQHINVKVAIYGKQTTESAALGNGGQGGIGQVHREVRVLRHQRIHSVGFAARYLQQNESPFPAHPPKPLLIAISSNLVEEVHCLREASPGGQEGAFGETADRVHAGGMVLIVFIQQCNEWTGIRQHYSFPALRFFSRSSPNLRPVYSDILAPPGTTSRLSMHPMNSLRKPAIVSPSDALPAGRVARKRALRLSRASIPSAVPCHRACSPLPLSTPAISVIFAI